MTGRRKSARASAERGKQARNTEEEERNARENQPAVSVRRLQLPHQDIRVSDGAQRHAKEKQERSAEDKLEPKAKRNQVPNTEDKQARNAEENQAISSEAKQERNAEDNPETSSEEKQEQNASEEREATAEEDEATAEEHEATAEEREATAEEHEATAEEREATAEEDEATAEEHEATAEEHEATAEEDEATAEEDEATAEEHEATAEEDEATAEEHEATADECEATAEEDEATAEEDEATAEEHEATAEEDEATAEEHEATAEEDEATAEEREATAEEREATAEEREATAEEQDSELLQKELSESSESDETSVRSRADVSDDAAEKENGDMFPSEEKENQCPDVAVKEYRCKYCAFTTLHLGDFKEHVDSAHPDVILNPLYLCVACNFTTKKFESLTAHNEERHPHHASFSFRKSRSADHTVLEQTIDAILPSANDGRREDVHALSVNGTVILPDASALHDSPHVSPMLQRPPNFSRLPQIAVPLNTTKYNPSLDDNATLIASFSRFPYPTHAELSWLTAASKHPEEQIRVWFTTQRLKQGITWAPEEVEEARKKMFNGSVPPPHGTLPVSKATVRTTTVDPPKQASPRNTLKRTSTASFGPEPKRPVMAVAPNPGEKGLMAPPPLPLKPTLDAKRAPVPFAPLMLQKPSPNSLKTWPIVPMPSMVFPESLTRRTITPAPFYSPQFQSNVLVPRPSDKTHISLPNGTLPNSAPLIPPHIRRPAVIQALRGNAEQNEPLDDPKSDVQQRAQVLTQFPLLERLKGKTAEQLKLLEESFLRNSFPTLSDMETLAATTRLSPAEVDSWFSERRALRDNLEQALLNSMGNRRNGPSHAPNGPSHAPNGSSHAPNGPSHAPNGPSHAPNGSSHAPNGPSVFATNGHAHNGHALNGHALNSNNSHAHNGHAINDHARNGHAPNSHGQTPNGYSSHAPNAPGPVEKMLQNGVHRAVPSRGPEELAVSRWSFVDDLTQRWFNADISGKTGSVLQSPELIGSRCLNSTNGRAQEAEPNWFKPPYERYNRMDLGPMFGRWTTRQDLMKSPEDRCDKSGRCFSDFRRWSKRKKEPSK
uniref:Homeobox domain-containing protein n=1 Tax=Neogobius melanostomus TaxID=47308 RepID=A0A8C6SK14_9GOBI